MEISQRPGCYVWNPFPQPRETVSWTGACGGGKAQGTGTLTWADDGGVLQTNTGGRLVDGEKNGHWVIRDANGVVTEGPYVDDEPNGHWVIRDADGDVAEGPMVDGERNGHPGSSAAVRSSMKAPMSMASETASGSSRMEGETLELSTLYRNGERVR